MTASVGSLVCLVLACSACRSDDHDDGTKISGPAVRLRDLPPASVAAGETARIDVELDIAAGHHIQANPASRKALVPATLELSSTPAIQVGATVYPPGHEFKLEGSEWNLSTYKGHLTLSVPITATAGSSGDQTVAGSFSYQACNRYSCLRPERLPIAITVRVR